MSICLSSDGDQLSDAEWTAVLRDAVRLGTFGDRFAEWVKEHTVPLMRSCRRLARGQRLFDCRTAAEEVFAEVCLIALTRLPDALTREDKPVQSVMGYVTSTCLRAAYEKLKFRTRNRSRSKPEVTTERFGDLSADGRAADHPTHHLPPDLHAEQEELNGHVRAAVESLPPHLRAIVAMHYQTGLTLAEIAARSGVPLGTVKARHQLAKKLLAETLAPLVNQPADEPLVVG
jgi:RNA polymerase sigma factor (sigma-70 family)